MEGLLGEVLSTRLDDLIQPFAPLPNFARYRQEQDQERARGELEEPFTYDEASELLEGYLTMCARPETGANAVLREAYQHVQILLGRAFSKMESVEISALSKGHYVGRSSPPMCLLPLDPQLATQKYTRQYAHNLLTQVLSEENLVNYAIRKANMVDVAEAHRWAKSLITRCSFLREPAHVPWILWRCDQLREYKAGGMDRWELGQVVDWPALYWCAWEFFSHYMEPALQFSFDFLHRKEKRPRDAEDSNKAWCGLKQQFGKDLEARVGNVAGDGHITLLSDSSACRCEACNDEL